MPGEGSDAPAVSSRLRLGADLVDVAWFRRRLERRPALGERLFTPRELAESQRRADPWTALAARFAAKEAFLKALGTGWSSRVGWLDLEVVSDGAGRPELPLKAAAERAADSAAAPEIVLSLAQDAHMALAFLGWIES